MMTFDIQRIVQCKQARRAHLARLPISEKLAMLDTLRERTLAIRAAAARARADSTADKTAPIEPGEKPHA